jgi:hypothetical protein
VVSISKIFPGTRSALRKVRTLPAGHIPRYVGALSGALAVVAFLGLPCVRVSFLGMDFTRNGTELIQSTFASSDVLVIATSVVLTLALVAAGLGSLLHLGRRHKHGSILGGASLAVLVGLCIYLVIREAGPKLIDVGLWLSVLLLVIMSGSTFLVSVWSKPLREGDDQDEEAS